MGHILKIHSSSTEAEAEAGSAVTIVNIAATNTG